MNYKILDPSELYNLFIKFVFTQIHLQNQTANNFRGMSIYPTVAQKLVLVPTIPGISHPPIIPTAPKNGGHFYGWLQATITHRNRNLKAVQL